MTAPQTPPPVAETPPAEAAHRPPTEATLAQPADAARPDTASPDAARPDAAGPDAASPGGAPADDAAAAEAASPGIPLSLLLGAALFVLVFGVAGWLWRGNAQGLAVAPGSGVPAAAAAAAEGQVPTAEQIEAMLGKLQERLKTQPDDLEGWTMLARSLTVLGRAAEAVPAWRRVAELQPQSAGAWADLADAIATANGGNLDGEPAQLVAKALQLDAGHLKTLALAGTIAFQHDEYAKAVLVWQRAVAAAEPGSEFARQLQGALAEAQQRLAAQGGASAPATGRGAPAAAAAGVAVGPAAGGSAPAAAAGGGASGPVASAAPAANARVAGRVRLAPALAAQVRPDDTLFVFARPADGSRMPLAILKRRAGDLPLDFSLDDSLAMNPAAALSRHTQVIVGARISRSGQALPQPGDLQGFSAPVAVGSSAVIVEIGETVR